MNMSRSADFTPTANAFMPGPWPGLTLADLLVLSGQGDLVSFQQLYDATSARIYSLVLRQVGPQRADVITQRIYVALYNQAADYQPLDTHPLAWIISVTGHALAEDRCASHAPRCVGSGLSRHHQDVLTLVYLGGYSQREVAELLNLDAGAVTSALRQGLEGLRRRLPPRPAPACPAGER